MPRTYTPTHIRNLNAAPETRAQLLALSQGEPWMTPQEKDHCAVFLRNILKPYNRSNARIAPTLAYHLASAMTYNVHLHRLEHLNCPQIDPNVTPESPQNHPKITPGSPQNYPAYTPDSPTAHTDPSDPSDPPQSSPKPDLAVLSQIRALRAQFRLTLQHLERSLPPLPPPPPKISREERRYQKHLQSLTPEQRAKLKAYPRGTTFDQMVDQEKQKHIQWRKAPPALDAAEINPPPEWFTPEELADLDRQYGSIAEKALAVQMLHINQIRPHWPVRAHGMEVKAREKYEQLLRQYPPSIPPKPLPPLDAEPEAATPKQEDSPREPAPPTPLPQEYTQPQRHEKHNEPPPDAPSQATVRNAAPRPNKKTIPEPRPQPASPSLKDHPLGASSTYRRWPLNSVFDP